MIVVLMDGMGSGWWWSGGEGKSVEKWKDCVVVVVVRDDRGTDLCMCVCVCVFRKHVYK